MDFYEGVEAKLIRKTNDPKWSPESIDLVLKSQIDKCFTEGENDKLRAEVVFTNSVDRSEANQAFALPAEIEIASAVQSKKTRELLQQYQSKLGLAELISKYL